MSTRKHILITGSNRSGSTWVGRVIASNSEVDTIVEPLNLNRIKRFERIELDYWYPKVVESSDPSLKKKIKKLIRYYLSSTYGTVLSQISESYEGHSLLKSAKKRLRKASKPIKMLKDPTAIFSVPWLVAEFGLAPVILIRHPAAYVLSIKDKNWWFDFKNLLVQPHFFTGDMAHLKDEVVRFNEEKEEKTLVENAALLWKVFYTQVSLYQEKYPNWFYVTHEELSLNPEASFKQMFDYLNLDFNEDVREYLVESTQAKNKAEFKRDSVKNTTKWQQKLTDAEKAIIYDITAPISDQYYEPWSS